MARPNSSDTSRRFITRQAGRWKVWIKYQGYDSRQQYFPDAAHGTKDAALSAAIDFRDKIVAEQKIPLRSYDGNGYCVQHRKSKTGEVGVTLAVDNPDHPTKVSWRTTIMVDGKQRPFSRSIRVHGYAEAWKQVTEVRSAHTGIAIQFLPPAPPEWLMLWAAERGIDLNPHAPRDEDSIPPRFCENNDC